MPRFYLEISGYQIWLYPCSGGLGGGEGGEGGGEDKASPQCFALMTHVETISEHRSLLGGLESDPQYKLISLGSYVSS